MVLMHPQNMEDGTDTVSKSVQLSQAGVEELTTYFQKQRGAYLSRPQVSSEHLQIH